MILAALFMVSVMHAAAADKLELARAAYLEVENERALTLLDEALTENPTDDEWLKIQELRATIHASYDRRIEARDTMRSIITKRPSYTPPAQSSPKILEAYGAAKALDMRQAAPVPHWYTNKWVWIGAGVVAAAVTTFAIVSYNNPSAPDGTYPVVHFGGP